MALGEEVIIAAALSKVVILPRLPACGGVCHDGLAVDEDFDGADVAG